MRRNGFGVVRQRECNRQLQYLRRQGRQSGRRLWQWRGSGDRLTAFAQKISANDEIGEGSVSASHDPCEMRHLRLVIGVLAR